MYPYGDPRRIFGQGTPKEVWHLMTETWAVVGASSNARITKDISGWERVCDKIIEAKGTIVPDENFRTGRRARKMHGEGDRKTKLRKRDRKSTHLLERAMGAAAVVLIEFRPLELGRVNGQKRHNQGNQQHKKLNHDPP